MGNNFWIYTKSTGNKSKARQMTLCHTKKLLNNKENNAEWRENLQIERKYFQVIYPGQLGPLFQVNKELIFNTNIHWEVKIFIKRKQALQWKNGQGPKHFPNEHIQKANRYMKNDGHHYH